MVDKKGDGPSFRWVASVGIEFAIVVGGLGGLGYWIDSRYDSAPWGVLIGAGVGLVGGTYNLIKDCLRAIGRSGGPDDEGRSPPP
jgi:F0F1-type ATP synthase assembly protein I